MPTITDARSTRRPGSFPVGGLLAALAIWFGGMAVGALVIEPETIVAFGPPERVAAAAAESDAVLVSATRLSLTLRGRNAGTVRSLYRHGAWLVWPGFDSGCLGTGDRGAVRR